METKLSSLEENLKSIETNKSDVKTQLDEALQDLDVLNNDKEVLDSERKRLENEKTELGLDLMTVTSEKIEIERKISEVETEKVYLVSQIKDLSEEKTQLEEQLKGWRQERKSLEDQLAESRDVAMKQKLSLDNKDQILGDLQTEVEELEMKNSSLEGSLCATQNEVSNLEAENKALFCSFEKVEETVRGYIHRCQDLEIQNDDLSAAKDDLNQTCLILESRMKKAEESFEEKSRELDNVLALLEEKDQLVGKFQGDIASLESKNNDLQEMIQILQQRQATCQEIALETEASLKRKISELEDRLYESRERNEKNESELDSVRGECRQLLDLNNVLSTQVSEGLSTTERLTMREEELSRRLEKALKELDVVHQGMNSELDQKWQAEDEILHLQSEIDQVTQSYSGLYFKFLIDKGSL